MRSKGALWLLLAAGAMIIEMSCSHAPKEQVAVDIWKPKAYQELQRHEGEDEVFRIYTTRNQVVATSSYTLTDSSVVINELLLDGRYYENTGNAAILQIAVPFEIDADQLAAAERWKEPHETRRTLGAFGVGVAVLAAVGAVIWFAILAGSFGD